MNKFIIKIEEENLKSLELQDIECFSLSSTLSKSFITEFKQKASDKIVLIHGDNAQELCQELDIDGIILDLSKEEKIKPLIKQAKSSNPQKIIGVISRSRRHEAMIISEEEPDFIIFNIYKDGIDNLKELTSWYNEFFLIQSAAEIKDEDILLDDITADIFILSYNQYKKNLPK